VDEGTAAGGELGVSAGCASPGTACAGATTITGVGVGGTLAAAGTDEPAAVGVLVGSTAVGTGHGWLEPLKDDSGITLGRGGVAATAGGPAEVATSATTHKSPVKLPRSTDLWMIRRRMTTSLDAES